jgi:hypothetical protein
MHVKLVSDFDGGKVVFNGDPFAGLLTVFWTTISKPIFSGKVSIASRRRSTTTLI